MENSILSLKIKYLVENIPKISLPRAGDIGIDLYAAENSFIDPNTSGLISCGIAIQMPLGYAAVIKDRSSMSKNLHIMAGVIDSSYTGEWKIRAYCHKAEKYTEEINVQRDSYYIQERVGFYVKKGMKIGQFIIIKDYNDLFKIEEVGELDNTERGSNGFGSTGV